MGRVRRILAFGLGLGLLIGACTPQELAMWEWFYRTNHNRVGPGDSGPKAPHEGSSLPGFGLDYSSPIPGEGLLSPFGPRAGRQHKGTDIWCSQGRDQVRAVRGGTVAHTGTGTGYGLLVVLDHGDGWASLYAHVDAFSVDVGDVVGQGQQLATCGRTGITTSPAHLHVEVRGPEFGVGSLDLEAYHSFLRATPVDAQTLFNI